MEVEAKFLVPDEGTLVRLERVDTLAGYRVSARESSRLADTYLDTAARHLLAAGYALRRRECAEDASARLSLKSLTAADGAIHRRDELEQLVPAASGVGLLPEGPLRDRILLLTGCRALQPVVQLRQRRTTRQMWGGARVVAALSLDRVLYVSGGGERLQHIAEVELLPEGSEEDLAALAACLSDEWRLIPEVMSKFEHALAWQVRE